MPYEIIIERTARRDIQKIKPMIKFLPIFLFFFVLSGCKSPTKTPVLAPTETQKVIRAMTDIMVHDITNPPLAARFFAYSCLAGYEVVTQNDSNFHTMRGVLNEYPIIEKPAISDYSYQLSAILAMLETAKKMQPSGALLDEYETKYVDSCQNIGFSKSVVFIGCQNKGIVLRFNRYDDRFLSIK